MENKLYRDEHRKVIGGVCAGLANYFNVDVSLVRVVFVLALLLKGGGFLIYFILWAVIPARPFYTVDDQFFTPPLKQPEPFVPAKKTISTGSLIGGIVLIMLGGYLLLEEYDIIPDLDFDKFWPVVLIVIGLVLMFGFWRRKPEPEQPKAATWDQKDTEAENKNDNDISSTDYTKTI
ncbi:PspC domain-containing protein [Mucilaginibacter paludis]|uniref:Phage shock protein C, PspC n=1 Tax=Mucilaginibacter paludis DSM 18603 TaxID=714943 RepID=H1YF37_9SPHI|nr:PspC domain-containing protein [Mucilaginibacter paludis]EHQ25290.1 phage shock protein C, PspC [Mucilaginibacter paludis DSM 18603]